MKTPSHWNKRNLLSNLLLPLGWLYNFATKLNIKFSTPKNVDKQVICIGNLTAGGTGKTPVAISLASLIQTLGKKPFFVSRGYGGYLKDVVVNNQTHTAEQVGDEPLLLARQAPVVVNPNRWQGACKAIENGAEIIIMDDGFQNPGLKKDLSFLVFDGAFGYGNGRGIPAGPLRESLIDGLKRANAIIIIGEDKHNLVEEFKQLPIFKGKIIPKTPKVKGKKVIAFAGIGRPEKFYTSLKENGFDIIQSIDFSDHHQYSYADIENLIALSKKHQAELYTTSKDFVKIPPESKKYFNVLEIDILWENKEALIEFIQKHIMKY